MSFLLSSVALMLGPFVYMLGQKHTSTRHGLDGFILITIAGIVCLHIVPEAWRMGGALSIVFLLAGLVFPSVLESVFTRAAHSAHLFVVLIAALGIVVHATLDGMALIPIGETPSLLNNELALGVILHRVPVGMTIWWALRPQFGSPVALATLGLIVLVTALSYYLGGSVLHLAEIRSLAFFQSFIAGSLVHVVLFGISHDHDDDAEPRMGSWAFRFGLLAGLVVIFGLPQIHSD